MDSTVSADRNKSKSRKYCSVPGCKTRGGSMYVFPKSEEKREKWRLACRLTRVTPTMNICSLHFSADQLHKTEKGRVRVNRWAVPSQNLPKASYVKLSYGRNTCVVPNCDSSRKNSSVTMHCFPRDVGRRNHWAQVCGLKKTLSRNSCICSKHFADSDFRYSDGVKKLKHSAVPTLCLPQSNNVVSKKLLTGGSDHSLSSAVEEVGQSTITKETTIGDTSLRETEGDKKLLKACVTPTQRLRIAEPLANKLPQLVKDAVPAPDQLPVISCEVIAVNARSDNPVHHIVPNESRNSTVKEVSGTFRNKSSVNNRDTDSIKGDVDVVSGEPTNEIISTWVKSILEKLGASPSKIYCPLDNCECASPPVQSESISVKQSKNDQVSHSTLLDLVKDERQLQAFLGISSATLDNFTESALELDVKAPLSVLPMKERIAMTLCKLRLNLSFECLAALFGTQRHVCCSCFSSTIHLLALVLKGVVYWPTEQEIKLNMPKCFVKFQDTRVILHCIKVLVLPPYCLKCRLSLHSLYSGCRIIKIIVGVAPSGLITFLSKAHSGRTPDKRIFENCDLIKKKMLDPSTDAVMVETGFKILEFCNEHHIKVHTLPEKNKKPLNFTDASKNIDVTVTDHLEKSIERMKLFKILEGKINTTFIPHIDDIITVIAGVVNLSPPISADHRFL